MFDLVSLIRQLLPPHRKTALNVGFFHMLFAPLGSFAKAVEQTRLRLLVEARATGQVALLQHRCNVAVFGSGVGGIYILDANSAAVDFRVVIPSTLTARQRSAVRGVLDSYKQAGKRYVITEQANATLPTGDALSWEPGYPYLTATEMVFAIQQAGTFLATLKRDNETVIEQLLTFTPGEARRFPASVSSATYQLTIRNLSASLTREASVGVIQNVTWQRNASLLTGLVRVTAGNVEIRLIGRNSTTYSSEWGGALIQDSTVGGVTYNRQRGFVGVTDGDYTLQARVTGQTAVTSIDLNLSTANQPPIVVNPMPDQRGKVGVPYSYPIPSNAFGDPDGFIQGYNTTGLPPGISHTPGTPIAGTPTTAGTYTVRVTVTDNRGATVFDEYQLVIDPADVVTNPNPPSGTTQFIQTNVDRATFVAEQGPNGLYRWRNTQGPSTGRNRYYWTSGQPWQTASQSDYVYQKGDEITVYYTESNTPNVWENNWDVKAYAKIVF